MNVILPFKFSFYAVQQKLLRPLKKVKLKDTHIGLPIVQTLMLFQMIKPNVGSTPSLPVWATVKQGD